jgi:flagellar protein FlbD
MIYVTRLNHSSVVLNCDLIEHIEATPDTVITLTTGQKITVLETAEEIIERVRGWRHSLLSSDPPVMENGSVIARPGVWHRER